MMYRKFHIATIFTLCIGLLLQSQPRLAQASADAALLQVPVNTGLDQALSSIDQSTMEILETFSSFQEYFQESMIEGGNSIREYLGGNPSVQKAAFLFLPGDEAMVNGGKSEFPEVNCQIRAITNPGKSTGIGGGAWERLVRTGDVQTSFATVPVNDSPSLSCLLQEIAEQNKLSINLQIHELLNQHIQAAQAKAFANQAQNIITATQLDWIQRGNQRVTRNAYGEIIDTRSFPLISDPEEMNNDAIQRKGQAIADGIQGDMNSGKFVIPETFDVIALAREAKIAAHNEQQGADKTRTQTISCDVTGSIESGGLGFATTAQFVEFMSGNSEAYPGPYDEIMLALKKNPACSELGAKAQIQHLIASQSAEIREADREDRLANNGIPSTRECVEGTNCSETRLVSTGGIAANTLYNITSGQSRRLENVKNADDLLGINDDPKEAASLAMNINGITPNQLSTFKTADDAVLNFYNTIKNGYFDLQGGTTDWALGAMMQIYDRSAVDQRVFAPEEKNPTTTE